MVRADNYGPIFAIQIHFELDITFITPGGVPGVFNKHVVQASGLISAIPDNENAVVYGVKLLIFNHYDSAAIFFIDDTARV